MARWKRILLLGLGWVLMLTGVLLLMDAGMRYRPNGAGLPALESLGGLAVAVAGWFLRRTAMARRTKLDDDTDDDTDED